MEARSRTVFGSGSIASQAEARATLDELVMAWARDIATGQPRYILELDADHGGKRCGCECVSCGEALIAVNAGKEEHTYRRRPHFRHPSGVSKDSCAVLAARAAALRLLIEDGVLDLPSRTASASWSGLSGQAYQGTASSPPERATIAHVEYRDRVSAVLELADGRRVYVTLIGTNIGEAKSADFDGKSVSTIFIDINDPALASLDPEQLRSRMKLLPGSVCWRGHWNDEALEQQAVIDAMEQARELLDWPTEDSFEMEQVPPDLRRETLLHLTVKEILAGAGQIRVPELAINVVVGTGSAVGTSLRDVIVKSQTISVCNVRMETKFGNVIPDVCAEGKDAGGAEMGTVFIEVTVTHGFDSERLRRISQMGRPALEIDMREAFGRISKSNLAKVVIDGLAGKRWLHYPGIEERRAELKRAADAAEQAIAEEVRLRREQSRESDALSRTKPVLPVLTPGVPPGGDVESAQGDLARCRGVVAKRSSKGWGGNEDLLDALVSLRHGIGVGHQEGLTSTQIAHKLRCTVDTRLHALVLMVLRAFEPEVLEGDSEVLAEWATSVRAKLKQQDAMWMPKPGDLILLKDLFPELEPFTEKLQAVLRRPLSGGPVWSSGELPTDRRHRVEAVRRFYRDGAYRLFAPAIDYDRVLDQARYARSNQVSLNEMLARWSSEFSLGDDHQPLLAVLREAGLVT